MTVSGRAGCQSIRVYVRAWPKQCVYADGDQEWEGVEQVKCVLVGGECFTIALYSLYRPVDRTDHHPYTLPRRQLTPASPIGMVALELKVIRPETM